VSFFVQNTGAVKGSEVPQVYLGPPAQQPASVQFASQKLVAFKRIELGPRDRQRVTLHVSASELSYWSTQGQDWVLFAGNRNVGVAASSRDIRLQGMVRVETGPDGHTH
jgi:beta-glucosidase